MRVLYIDDEQEILDVVSDFLQHFEQQHGEAVEVTTLIDPMQGLYEILNKGHKYDLILLDVRMPQLTGADIYQKIAGSCPELLERVVFITAFRYELDSRFPNQQLNVLEKPFAYAQLENIIQSVAK